MSLIDRMNGRRGKRGPADYRYSLQDVAALTGLSLVSVQSRRRRGEFDARSLESVVRFVVARRRDIALSAITGGPRRPNLVRPSGG